LVKDLPILSPTSLLTTTTIQQPQLRHHSSLYPNREISSTKMAPLSKAKSKTTSKGSKADQSSSKSAIKPSGPRVNFTHEGHHHDDEVILPETFPFAEAIPSWGPNFNPNVMNAALGKQFSKGHHVTKGGTGKKRRDFENFTLAFCLEWIHDSEGNWCRCCNQFTVETHPKVSHKDGPNQIYRHMKEGRKGNWGMIKNRHIQPDEVPLTPAEITAKRFEDIEAEVTKYGSKLRPSSIDRISLSRGRPGTDLQLAMAMKRMPKSSILDYLRINLHPVSQYSKRRLYATQISEERLQRRGPPNGIHLRRFQKNKGTRPGSRQGVGE
jgi:hypothetical protein